MEAILVHQYHNNGYNIALDVDSGSVHIVDDLVYDVIAKLKDNPECPDETVIASVSGRYPEADVREALEEVRYLQKEGQLFARDIYRDSVLDFRKRQTVVKALCLHIAHDCNLACEYCFAEEGEYHGRRALMSYEVGKKALDFLVDHSGSRRNLEVDFFGGEPLMNFQVVKDLVAYGRSLEKEKDKHFRFTITTNGVLLNDEIMEFCNAEMDNVVMSLDGRREVHDRMRPFRNGKGSYDLIVPKFQKFAALRKALGKQFYIRGTFTHYNLDFAQDILHFADLGFDQLSMEPVVTDPSSPSAITKEDLPVVFEQYEELARLMVERYNEGRPFTFYHYMLDLTCGPCIYKRIAGCGSGTEYLAVTPWGDLYPCHQFVGDEAYKMGSIYDGVQNLELRDKFASCNAYSRPECKDCWAKLYCSGGCAANSYHASGDINGIYEMGCDIFRKRIECAIAVKLLTSGLEQPGKEN